MKKNIRNKLSRRNFLKNTGAIAAGVSVLGALPESIFSAEEKILNFYNWDTYTGENTLSWFKSRFDVDVKMDLFANNEELFSKLRNGNPGYDLIVPTGDLIPKLLEVDLLIPLDYSKIPNQKNLFQKFTDASFDPGRKYSVTYMWGTIGIGYNSKRVKQVPDSWKVFYDSDEYAGRLGVFDNPRDFFGFAMKYLGYSFNDSDPKKWQEAFELALAHKKNYKAFHADNGQDILLSGEVDLVQEYSGDIAQINEEDENMQYIVPKEGSSVWQDVLAIPKGAPHPDNAHKFINFLLDPKVGADTADTIQYATPNEASFNIMDDSYTKNSFIFPDIVVLNNCEEQLFLGIEFDQMLSELFTKLKAS